MFKKGNILHCLEGHAQPARYLHPDCITNLFRRLTFLYRHYQI